MLKSFQRQRVRRRGTCYARHGIDPRHQLPDVCRQLRGIREAIVGDRQAQRQHVGRVEPQLDLHHLEETANEKSAAGQQNKRERHFDHHERAAKSTSSAVARRPAAPLFHRACEIEFRGAQRRCQAKNNSGRHGERKRKRENAQVHLDVDRRGQIKRRQHVFQPHHQPIAQGNAEQASNDREKKVLGKELANEPAATRAQRSPDGNFALTRGAACQHQIRDVRTPDEQQHADCGEQYIERSL